MTVSRLCDKYMAAYVTFEISKANTPLVTEFAIVSL